MTDIHEKPAPVPGVPVRYRTTPLVALVALALVPAVGLSALVRWSDNEADEYELVSEQVPEAPEPVAAAAPALTTSVVSYRRTPTISARSAGDKVFADAMGELHGFVDQRSCVSVRVDDRSISAWNGDVAVIPGSTNKLLVAGVAMELLGADHVFTTSLAGPAAVDGEIDGNVFLVGGGDPVLVASDFDAGDDAAPPTVTTSLDELVDAIVAAGITSIRGAVVGDATRYDEEYVNPAWETGVGFVDAGPIAGLVVNDGQTVGRSGRQRDPGEAAARELTRLLRDRGVSVSNRSDSGVTEPEVTEIASVSSVALGEIVADMLTRSDNDTAEMLLKEIGLVSGEAGTTAAGLEVARSTIASWGVSIDSIAIVDGSGLGATNRLTCDTLVDVLAHLRGTPTVDGLPIAGRSGTLVDDLIGTPVEGRLVAKTGTLTNPPPELDPPEVKALAGYLAVDNGETISFSIVLNGPGYVTSDGYVPFWGALAERLAAYPAPIDPAVFGPR